jgi:hypothetical protein
MSALGSISDVGSDVESLPTFNPQGAGAAADPVPAETLDRQPPSSEPQPSTLLQQYLSERAMPTGQGEYMCNFWS